MQYMQSYYAIELRLRYYGRLPDSTSIQGASVVGELGNETVDVRRWKEPPHEYLANMLRNERDFCGPASVEAFVRRYGILTGQTVATASRFFESCINFTAFQEKLRRAWQCDHEGLLEIEAQLEILDVISTQIDPDSGCVVLATENLWTFICFFFHRDLTARKAKVCKSPDCPNPFFIQQRKGQLYCSHVCAVRENVRRFRRAEAQARETEVPRNSGKRRPNGVTKTR